MFIADGLRDYRILDAGDGMKLEDWDGIVLSRPDPQVIWPISSPAKWKRADAVYHRSDQGGGSWEFNKPLPERWTFTHHAVKMYVKPTGFKHTGVFPEQSANWDWIIQKIRSAKKKPVRVLNLFGYTGGASLAALSAGAEVVHIDAAQSMITWFKDNLSLSKLADSPVRYIAEDCMKFVLREQRRGNTYDGIIMDPPSYGRGKGGEVWKLEKDIYGLIEACVPLLTPDPLFVLINAYTTGLSHVVMDNMMKKAVSPIYGGKVSGGTLCLPVAASGLYLPCGTVSRWEH